MIDKIKNAFFYLLAFLVGVVTCYFLLPTKTEIKKETVYVDRVIQVEKKADVKIEKDVNKKKAVKKKVNIVEEKKADGSVVKNTTIDYSSDTDTSDKSKAQAVEETKVQAKEEIKQEKVEEKKSEGLSWWKAALIGLSVIALLHGIPLHL